MRTAKFAVAVVIAAFTACSPATSGVDHSQVHFDATVQFTGNADSLEVAVYAVNTLRVPVQVNHWFCLVDFRLVHEDDTTLAFRYLQWAAQSHFACSSALLPPIRVSPMGRALVSSSRVPTAKILGDSLPAGNYRVVVRNEVEGRAIMMAGSVALQ